jgi:membrane fusion protein, copper/silver efflux system
VNAQLFRQWGREMKKATYLVVLVASVTMAFVIGSWTSPVAGSAVGARRIHHYACPMHPAFTSQHPGTAPCCGMAYEPVYEDAPTVAAKSDLDGPPGTVHVLASMQQAIGVQVSEVRAAGGSYTVRLFGRVAADEQHVYALNAGIDGTIREVFPITTGSRVRKNQLLGTYTAPELLMSVQAYILALDGLDRRRKGELAGEELPPIVSSTPTGVVINSIRSNFQQRIDRLRLLGMSDVQIEEIARTRDVPPFIKILAPSDGIVLARNASPGRTFVRGEEWFRIADLRRVWVVVDVFGDDATRIRPGMAARVSLPRERLTFTARVSDVPPQYNPETRTRTVRLEVDNLEDVLRPEMPVDVELSMSFAPTVVVPSGAVIESGLKTTVFVERAPGSYEPREVKTGWRRDGRIEIVQGLAPGDRVVGSGTFFLDSDSRMRLGASARVNPQ